MSALYERLDALLGSPADGPGPDADGVQFWRHRVLDVALVVGLAVGTLSVIPGVTRAALEQNWVLLVADVAVLLLAAYILLHREIQYRIRAGLLVAAAFGIGLVQLVTSGVHTPAPLWLFASPVLAAILFDLRVAMAMVGVVLAAFLVQLGADQAGLLPPALAAEVGSPRWVEVATDLVLLAVVVSLFMGVLLQGLRTSFDRVRRIRRDLEQERVRLLETNRELEMEVERRMRAEEERSRLASAMEQARKMQALGTFAGGIAHDFNNLLVPIMGTAELLREELPEKAGEQIDDITRAARRGKELVAQILAFSRGGERRHSSVRLASVVRDSERLLRASLPADIRLDFELDERCAVPISDAEAQQVLMNLCMNAFHAMRAGGGVLRVAVDRVDGGAVDTRGALAASPLDRDRTYGRLAVEDTGEGMEDHTLARVLEPFFTTKPNGQGTGLGLAMVHGVALGVGGTVVIRSAVGRGTRVEVLLPTVDEEEQTATDAPERASGAGQRVLVVDDEAPVREVVARFLERLGFRAEAVGPEEGRRILESDRPIDLLVTDLSMPGLDGLELGRIARRNRGGIPMVLCTGLVDAGTTREANMAGFDQVLSKPFDMAELSAVVHQVIAPAGRT